MRKGPPLEITADEIPEHPGVLDRWALSDEGYVTSVQATKIRKGAASAERLAPSPRIGKGDGGEGSPNSPPSSLRSPSPSNGGGLGLARRSPLTTEASTEEGGEVGRGPSSSPPSPLTPLPILGEGNLRSPPSMPVLSEVEGLGEGNQATAPLTSPIPSPSRGEGQGGGEIQPPSRPSPLEGEEVAEPLTRLSLALQRRYARKIAENSGLPVKCIEAPDGAVRFRLGPVTLIDMGPPEPAGRPGLTRRTVRGGALLAEGDEGAAAFEISVSESGGYLIFEHWLRDYRSALRGTAPNSKARAWLYRKTQLTLHATVGKRFWRGMP